MRNLFLFVVWSKAREFENEIRVELARRFKIVCEREIVWPRGEFAKRLFGFYEFGTRFTWWNKARKCGRGPFMAIVVEDANPVWHHRRDTRGQDLLVDDNVFFLKAQLRHLTHHRNRVHSSLTADETRHELAALGLKRAVESGAEIPSAERLEAMYAGGELARIGDGSRRVCYAVPGTALCMKGYRGEADLDTRMRPDGTLERHAPKPATLREIRRARMDERANTSCQEWRYWHELKDRLPQELMAVFPETMERVMLPSLGWCLVEDLVTNFDGTPAAKLHAAYKKADEPLRAEMLRRLKALEDALVRHAVRFYDPQNVMVQWTGAREFRLRIIDFEPASRTLVRLDAWCAALARLKVRRRFARYRRMHKW